MSGDEVPQVGGTSVKLDDVEQAIAGVQFMKTAQGRRVHEFLVQQGGWGWARKRPETGRRRAREG